MYPNVPTISIGPTSLDHPFDIAIAAAVVGPPIFALDARIASYKLNLNIFATINVTSMFISTIIPQYKSSNGDF